MLLKVGFDFTAQQLFLLVDIPNLVGSLIRLPYSFAVPKFGGRNWTVVSALMLLIPTLLFAWAVQRPETPYWVFVVIAATAGVGGGNFAPSMANINFFYPTRELSGLRIVVQEHGQSVSTVARALRTAKAPPWTWSLSTS